MMQAIARAAKAPIMAVDEAEHQVNTTWSVQAVSRTDSPAQKQQIFDWKAADNT